MHKVLSVERLGAPSRMAEWLVSAGREKKSKDFTDNLSCGGRHQDVDGKRICPILTRLCAIGVPSEEKDKNSNG